MIWLQRVMTREHVIQVDNLVEEEKGLCALPGNGLILSIIPVSSIFRALVFKIIS